MFFQKCASVERRPVWFVFTGMGTQWPGMGRALMGLDVFRHSLERSDAVLKPHGVALCEMINRADDETFTNTLNSFVAIAAIQVKN